MTRWIILVCSAFAMSGCASGPNNFPSLARRDVERVSGSAAVVPAPVPAAVPSESVTSDLLETLIAKSRSAHARFMARRERAEQTAVTARGAASGSEAWSIAQVARADLESARSEAMIAMADIDALYAAERIAGHLDAATESARDTVIALIAEQDRVLAALR